MTILFGEIADSTLKYLDEYSSRGVPQSANKIADYMLKIKSLINPAIYDLATTTAKIPKTFNIVHAPIKNTLADDTSAIKTHMPGLDFSIALQGALSTYFEATGPATVIIEETSDGTTYMPLETISIDSGAAFNEYRRLIAPTLPNNTIRLRFTGDYVYNFRNYVLYPVSFASEDEIQQHREFFFIDLPEDFLDVNTVFVRRLTRQYVSYANYNITPGPNQQFVFNSYDGPCEFSINYWRKPNLLTFTGVDAADRALPIDLADEAALIIPLNIAGEIFKSEKQLDSGVLLLNQFSVRKNELSVNKTGYSGIVVTPYVW